MSGYGDAAPLYRDAGWLGVLHVPRGRKKPVPTGHTGNDGAWPSDDDIERWRQDHADANVALRVPEDVLGLDVDEWKVPGAWDALLELLEVELPATWCSGARVLPSGIYWYRVPAGRRFKAVPLPGVEVVQFHHRYGIVPPSIHPERMEYRWRIAPAERELPMPVIAPPLSGLTELPPAAVAALTDTAPVGEAREPVTVELTDGEMASTVEYQLKLALADLDGAGRHDAAMGHVMVLVRMAEGGRSGVAEARRRFDDAYVAAVADRSDEREARAELARLWDGAIALAQRTHPPQSNGSDATGERSRSLGGGAPEFCDESSCGCGESGVVDVGVEGVVDVFEGAAELDGGGWLVGGVEEGAE